MTPKFTSVVGLLSIVLAGCGAGRVNLTGSGVVKTEILSTQKVYVSRLHAYGEEGRLVVSGNIKPDFRYTSWTEGHVDVAVLGPGNAVLGLASVSYTPRPLFPPARGRIDSYFVAHFPTHPPEGSVIRATYHDRRFIPETGALDCGENAAAQTGGGKS